MSRVRGDATNSSAYRGFKLFASEVFTAAFVPKSGAPEEEDREEEHEEGVELMETHRSFPDLTWLENKGHTARCHYDMWNGQLSSIGLRSWDANVGADEINYNLGGMAVVHLNVYLVCTDAGADEAGTKTIVLNGTAGLLTTWVLWIFCFMHQVHLMIKRQLQRADAVRLFSNIAMMSNVWRSPTQSKRFFQGWANLFGIQRAKAVANRVPTRCLRGRWSSVHKVVAFFLKCTMTETAAVFKYLYGDQGAEEHPERPPEDTGALEEESQDFRAQQVASTSNYVLVLWCYVHPPTDAF